MVLDLVSAVKGRLATWRWLEDLAGRMERIESALAGRRLLTGRAGRTPAEQSPWDLEIRHPLATDSKGLPDLPCYLPREHEVDHSLASTTPGMPSAA
ncbi:hypothetical protein AB0B66_37125 [Catellatospora sp. NPDC049111]|uniref:hypothetical protein n=1 Tax=Catellatospora sp. NPDC049111 TaxID=3155271 RepID=UPI0033C5D750